MSEGFSRSDSPKSAGLSKKTTQADAGTLDAEMLRALMHPTRRRIMRLLDLDGYARAADIAGVLGVTPNLASFHLRALAKVGLVIEDPDLARDGRDRVWIPAAKAFSSPIESMRADQDSMSASTTYGATVHQELLERVVGEANGGSETAQLGVLVNLSFRGTRADLERFMSEVVKLTSTVKKETPRNPGEKRDWEISIVAGADPVADDLYSKQ